MVNFQAPQPNVRLAEVIASLCIAADLAMGQPLEHGLRRALLAIWLGEELGLNDEELSDAYYVALLDRKSTRLNSSHIQKSRMPSSA